MYAWKKIKEEIAANINAILGDDLATAEDLIIPPKPEFGDLGIALFALAKKTGTHPVSRGASHLSQEGTLQSISEKILNGFKFNGTIIGAKSTGPYLNFFLDKKNLTKSVITEIDKEKDCFGHNAAKKGKKIVVEFAHPNPFKSFHIGHLRNILLGESIVRLMESAGAKVVRINYQGDVGMHIAKCLWSFQKIDPKDYPATADLKVALLGKCYAEGARAFEDSPAAQAEIKEINQKIYSGGDPRIKTLWKLGKKWSLEKFQEIYRRVYSRFDREYMESEVIKDCLKYVARAKARGILEESEGAVVFRGEKYGLETRVFLNSDGLPTYEGKELGLAYREFSDFGKIDLCVHNVGVEQKSFFAATFKVEELLDEKKFKGRQYHNAYELVGLSGGKMSSRLGNVVLGNDILNEAGEEIKKIIAEKDNFLSEDKIEKIAVAAVKYAFLKISAFKYLSFDLEESVNFSGNSGPYLLYTFARIRSIFRKITNYKLKIKNVDFEKLSDDKEIALIKKLAVYPEIVEAAGKIYDPAELAKYLFELTKLFNDYYHQIPVLKVETAIKNARLSLLSSVAQIIGNGLNLLGIKTVEEM
jgi:arginyl-tRNA synthetase